MLNHSFQFFTIHLVDIIKLRESILKLNESILDAEIEVEGFKFYRKDRDFDIKEDVTDHDENSNSSGGGSIIYCKEHIKVKLVKRFSKLAPDSLAVNINTNSGKMYIVCVYRSQNLSNSLNSALLSSLKDVCKESNLFETLLVGDFNLPDISWEHCNLKCVNSNSTNNKILLKQAEFINLFNELGLNWYLVNET